jgi:hypothetical protein
MQGLGSSGPQPGAAGASPEVCVPRWMP